MTDRARRRCQSRISAAAEKLRHFVRSGVKFLHYQRWLKKAGEALEHAPTHRFGGEFFVPLLFGESR